MSTSEPPISGTRAAPLLVAALLSIAQAAPYAVHRQVDDVLARLEFGSSAGALARELGQLARHATDDARAWHPRAAWSDLADGATPEQLRIRAKYFKQIEKLLRSGENRDV